MKSLSYKRALSPFLFAGVVLCLFHCGGDDKDEKSFSTDGDAAVVSGLVGVWTATSASGKSYTMVLCEDTSARNLDLTTLSCQTLHQVRGGGRGVTETVSPPEEGCGGCTYDNSAYVTGAIGGGDLLPTFVSGQFALSGGDTTSLALPYAVDIGGAYGYVRLLGEMPSVDTIALDSLSYVPATAPDDGDASEPDAGNVDAGDGDAGDGDAGHVDSGEPDGNVVPDAGIPVPAPLTSSQPDESGTPIKVPNVTFHRTGTASCKAP